MRAELLRANFQRRSKETSATKEQIKGTAARASSLLNALAKTLSLFFLLFLTSSLLKANKPRSPGRDFINSIFNIVEAERAPDWRSLDRNNVIVNQTLGVLCEATPYCIPFDIHIRQFSRRRSRISSSRLQRNSATSSLISSRVKFSIVTCRDRIFGSIYAVFYY